MPFDRARIAFGPEALSRFTQIIEEVTVDLVDDGLPVELMRSDEMRTRLAQRLLASLIPGGRTLRSSSFC